MRSVDDYTSRMDVVSEVPNSPGWPSVLMELCLRLRNGSADRDALRARLWAILRESLLTALRRQLATRSSLDIEDISDLASTKALELLRRAERGDWDPVGRTPAEVVAYIRSTARHALIATARQNRRTEARDPTTEGTLEDPDWHWPWVERSTGPEECVESREFATGLLHCVGRMRPRSQRIWYLRVVLDLNARDIATHPDVRLSQANVDVILMRARGHVRECLAAKGLAPGHVPRGAFAELWDRISHAAGTAVLPGRDSSPDDPP